MKLTDVGHRNVRCGHWEFGTYNPRRTERTSARLIQLHLGSHSGPSQGYGYPFHEILGPEFQVNSSCGINQQRPLHFQCHASFKVDEERFESYSSGRGQERRFGVKRKRDSSENELKKHRPCVPAPVTQVSSIQVPPAETNVTELYERLVTTGILPHGKADAACKNKEEATSIKPVDFNQPETLKM
jgi:hypothetical protein